jgi:hypothetical protein
MYRLPMLISAWILPVFAAPTVDYQRDVRTILARKCFACHGPDEHARKANLRLDTFEGAAGRNGGYPGIVPGDSARSRVVARITDPKFPMPPTGERLNGNEIETLRRWIDEGAVYTRHWAFEKPVRHEPPTVSDPRWPVNAIDRFVLARLDREGLKPSPEAGRYTLARRLALDLTGLPPSPAMVEAFVRDRSPQAYERFVDKLLAMPQYGERWARVWLDLARYADTQGYEKDNRRTIWPYRDWVVKAFNENMPFDQFTVRQIAGDLLPDAQPDDLIATGFHRNTMTNTEGGTDDEEFRDLAVKDRVATTGQVWMGLTWGCAQCHSHKYDPLSHKEFYQLYAFFNQSEDSDKPDDRPVLRIGQASTLILRELESGKRRTTRIHERGNFLNPGAEVQPAAPEAFHPMAADAPRNRLGLAQWLVSSENPLTARVQVNRYWARLWGRGLVESEEDFGTQGAAPVHPELLDWLATEFVRLNWDMKALLKTMVMSATYRQASDVAPALLEKDPYNRLLARGARYRLDAEAVRDQALAVSGLLSGRMGGPPVMPWQPEGIWQVVYNGETWRTSAGEDRYRRSLYTFLRRTAPYPTMITYDAPTGETCTIRRVRTNTPLQALASLNDPVSMEAAQQLALRVLAEAGGSDKARAERMMQRILVRPPFKEEVERVLRLHREATATLKAGGDPGKLLNYGKLLYTEDREIPLITDVRTKPSLWRFTLDNPGDTWTAPGFDASSWRQGEAPFGQLPKPDEERPIHTTWETERIWLRAEFDLPEGRIEDVRLAIRNLGAFDLYLNGVPAVSTNLDRNAYYDYPVSKDALRTLKPGRNVMAIHAMRIHEKSIGQFLDVSFQAMRPLAFDASRRGDASRAAWVAVANALLNLDETVTRR